MQQRKHISRTTTSANETKELNDTSLSNRHETFKEVDGAKTSSLCLERNLIDGIISMLSQRESDKKITDCNVETISAGDFSNALKKAVDENGKNCNKGSNSNARNIDNNMSDRDSIDIEFKDMYSVKQVFH